MKKIIISIICTLTLLTSCHGDLDVDHKSALTTGNMWKTMEDAVSARNGMYRQLRSALSTSHIFWGEYRTGLWGPGNDGSEGYRDELYMNKIPASNGLTNWGALYTTISDANFILKYTPNLSAYNEAEKKAVMADALFVRAYCYYLIARVWGDAPVLLAPYESGKQDNLFPFRDGVDKVFAQVESDIEEALGIIPDTWHVADRNMATKTVINTLKADVYLWNAKVRKQGAPALQKAQEAMIEIKKDTKYQLSDDYASIFTNKKNPEVIFAISMLRDEAVGGYPDVFLEAIQNVTPALHEKPVKVGSVRQRCFYTPEYMAFLSSDNRDTRTKMSYETFFDVGKNRTQQWINKFAGTWDQSTRIFDSNILIYRYADVLLLSAELNNELGNTADAVEELNKIAKRAYKVDNYYPKSLSKEEVNSKILDERMKEFAAEGKLWWDFIRMGQV